MASEQLPERATARDIDARSALALLLLVARQGDEFFRRGFGVELPLDAGRLFRRVQRVRHLGFAEDWKRDARGLVHWLIRHQGQLVICKSDLTAAPLELHDLFGVLRIWPKAPFIILAQDRPMQAKLVDLNPGISVKHRDDENNLLLLRFVPLCPNASPNHAGNSISVRRNTHDSIVVKAAVRDLGRQAGSRAASWRILRRKKPGLPMLTV